MSGQDQNDNPGPSNIDQEKPDCCIHCVGTEEKLTKLQNANTWDNLQRAAEIRDKIIDVSRVDPSTNLPILSYHRKCFQRFTMKKDLERIQARKARFAEVVNAAVPLPNQETETSERSKRSANSSTILPKECIFCKKRKMKGNSTEKISLCMDERAQSAIISAATKKNDFEILSINDLIAVEARYHSSCYKQYCKINYLPESFDDENNLENDDEKESYKDVIFFCMGLDEEPDVVPVSELIGMMTDKLKQKGKELNVSWKKNFSRKILNDVPSIKIINVDRKAFLYPRSISIETLITKLVRTTSKLEQRYKNRMIEESNIVDAMKVVKKEINQLHNEMPWPPQPCDLVPESFKIPGNLNVMLNTLLDLDESGTSRYERLKYSFAQDLVYAISHGRIKTPKSILFPSIVKTLTNNTEVINMINKLGHGVCYSTLMEIQTENAYSILSQQTAEGYILPLDCKREAFSIYVADNIDRKEETVSGYGTTHKVNNLIIQFGGEFAETRQAAVNSGIKRNRRSFNPPDTANHFETNLGKRVDPGVLSFPENDEKVFLFADRERINFIYSFLRCQSLPTQIVPSWTGFNIVIEEGLPVMKSSVHYLDCIDNPATEKSTIYQVMSRALNIIQSLHLVSIVCVFDQAIYCKACEIKWREPEKFKNCVLMMGMFHLIMTYMAVLNKRFSSAGLKDVLIQSGVIAEGSVDAALKGKAYNRGIRMYKLFYESLQRLLIDKMTAETTDDSINSCFTKDVVTSFSQSEQFSKLFENYLDTKDNLVNSPFSLPRFWMSYIEMVDILLNLLYACRAGHWDMLLECTREILPFAFAYDHINYARYLTYMLGDMIALESNFPEVYEQCSQGNFAAQLTEGVFNRVETDKVIEMTLNKETKTPGGTTGFSTSIGAVKRWEINAAYRASLRSVFHQHLNYSSKQCKHKDLSPSRIKKDECDIQAILDILRNTFIDPFTEQSLTSISTGFIVNESTATAILSAKETGFLAMTKFIDERLSANRTKSIFDTITKQKVPTFESLNLKVTVKTKNLVVTLKSAKDLFSKVAIIGQKRNVDLKQLFSFPLVNLPLALAEPDGSLKKTAKSQLLHTIEDDTPPASQIRSSHAFVVDGMAYVRQVKVSGLSYKQFSSTLLNTILNSARFATRIDVVFDVYNDDSIKNVERNRRSSGELSIQRIVPTASIKQWNHLLSSGDFKNKLVSFLVEDWKTNKDKLGERIMILNNSSTTYRISQSSVETVPELQSNHEEADTRMLLHAKHASNDFEKIIIATPDTDVFIIALAKIYDIEASLYMLTGTGDKRRLIDLMLVAENAAMKLNNTNCSTERFLQALPGFHSFTGCDSTSSFAGRGKKKALKLLGSNQKYIEAFSNIGLQGDLDESEKEVIKDYVCHMYGKKDAGRDGITVNDLRYHIYCQKQGKVMCGKLPPCLNVLEQHLKRSVYQAKIWASCFEQTVDIGEPEGNGWTMNDGKLDIVWMTCKVAPEEVVELITCKCRTCNDKCQCVVNGFLCTDACRCKTCTNVGTDDEETDEESSEDESDDSDDE